MHSWRYETLLVALFLGLGDLVGLLLGLGDFFAD